MDKIICVGKNYLDHAKELGDAVPEKPVLFLKPPSTLHWLSPNASMPMYFQDRMDHELEIVMRIRYRTPLDRKTKSDEEFPWYFDAFALGIDWTRRDLQAELKKKGQPWEIAKAFRASTFVGPLTAIENWPENTNLDFELKINGQTRQKGRSNDMRVQPLELLKMIHESFDLCDGDLLFTGTPAGVGPVQSGDHFSLTWSSETTESEPLAFTMALK